MRLRTLAAACFTAALFTSLSGTTRATTLVAKDLRALTEDADNICTARVIDAVSFLEDGRIYTLNRVRTVEAVKGRVQEGQIIEVVTAGGHSELFSQKVFGAAELEVDGEYLLFLEHRGTPELSHTVGMTQGALPIAFDGAKKTRLVHPPKALPRLMKRDSATGRFHAAAPWITEARPLTDILSEVRNYLGGDR